MYQITATAPTNYQFQSLSAFGMPMRKNLDGTSTAKMSFETLEQAKEYLTYRAENYYDGNSEGDEAKLIDALNDIEICGRLRLDAVTAHIEQVNEQN